MAFSQRRGGPHSSFMAALWQCSVGRVNPRGGFYINGSFRESVFVKAVMKIPRKSGSMNANKSTRIS